MSIDERVKQDLRNEIVELTRKLNHESVVSDKRKQERDRAERENLKLRKFYETIRDMRAQHTTAVSVIDEALALVTSDDQSPEK